MSQNQQAVQEKKTDKELYEYQQGAISQIFDKFDNAPEDYHLLTCTSNNELRDLGVLVNLGLLEM